MKKIEEILNVATNGTRNIIISTGVLLLTGYILGFFNKISIIFF